MAELLEFAKIVSLMLIVSGSIVAMVEIFSGEGPFIGLMLIFNSALISLLFTAPFKMQLKEIEKEEIITTITKAPEEYSFYLNGQDVDFEKIDLDQYDVSYDLEKKKVFLSEK